MLLKVNTVVGLTAFCDCLFLSVLPFSGLTNVFKVNFRNVNLHFTAKAIYPRGECTCVMVVNYKT